MRIFIYIFLLLTISACSDKMKHKVGITEKIPDENLVTKIKSLQIPPHYNLLKTQE